MLPRRDVRCLTTVDRLQAAERAAGTGLHHNLGSTILLERSEPLRRGNRRHSRDQEQYANADDEDRHFRVDMEVTLLSGNRKQTSEDEERPQNDAHLVNAADQDRKQANYSEAKRPDPVDARCDALDREQPADADDNDQQRKNQWDTVLGR